MNVLLSIALFCLSCGFASAEPDHAARWNQATLNPRDFIRLEQAVARYQRTAGIYESVEKSQANGVPAPVIFALHMRESDNSFRCHLHEGSPLNQRTRLVPKGRIPNVEPPYTWRQSAEDALYGYERLHLRNWSQLAPALQAAESYNGLGYQSRGLVSPYLWSGTSIYRSGKFVADGRFSANAVDAQLGVCAVLKRMQQRGIAVRFLP